MVLHISFVAIEEKIVRPPSGATVQVSFLVAQSGKERYYGAHLGAQCGSDYAQRAALASAGHKEVFAIELLHRSKVLGGTHASQIHIAIVISVARVDALSRIVAQRVGTNAAIVVVGLRERQAVNTQVEGNHTLLGRRQIAAYLVHTGARHAHHGRIATRRFGHGKNAIHCSHRGYSRFVYIGFLGA